MGKIIRESLYFIFNGETSESHGIYNVNVGSGMLEEPFASNRQVIEERVRGNPVSYLIDVQEDTLKFPVSFAFKDKYDEDKIRAVARWLLTKRYAPLKFSENLDRIFYGIFVGDSKLIHNGLKQGYITLEFQCNSAYSYTPVYTAPISGYYDYSNNTLSGVDYIFKNDGDLPTKPLITVEIIGGNSFSIVNSSNKGQKLEFEGLQVGEVLTIDCEAETITTSTVGMYRYGNMTQGSDFLEMVYGQNFLNIKGKIKIQWKWQSPLLQG